METLTQVAEAAAKIEPKQENEAAAQSDTSTHDYPKNNGKRRAPASSSPQDSLDNTADRQKSKRPRIRNMELDDLLPYFDKPIEQAATALGCCSSALKRRTRKLGVDRWPYRRLHSSRLRGNELHKLVEQKGAKQNNMARCPEESPCSSPRRQATTTAAPSTAGHDRNATAQQTCGDGVKNLAMVCDLPAAFAAAYSATPSGGGLCGLLPPGAATTPPTLSPPSEATRVLQHLMGTANFIAVEEALQQAAIKNLLNSLANSDASALLTSYLFAAGMLSSAGANHGSTA